MIQAKKLVKPLQKQMLYLTSVFLWLSGMIWLYFRYFAQVQTEFGVQTHPAQSLCLKIHGAAAIGFLITFGVLLAHMQSGWREKCRRITGLPLLMTCGLLILTGWGLYYVGHEGSRNLTSLIHSFFGIFLPAFIFWHIWTNRHRSRKS